MSQPHSVFVSYSHKDEAWKDLLLTQLVPLVGSGVIAPWHDRLIDAGEDWYDKIQQAMARATLAICLLSEDFLRSDFCTREEIGYLLDRRRHGLRLVPILIRPCAWRTVPWMSALQQLPRDGHAIADAFPGRESEALSDIAKGLAAILDDPEYDAAPAPQPECPELDERHVNLDDLPATGYELFGRRPQLENLDFAWKSPGIHVIVLAGRGGVGKSTLAGKWLERMKADNYRGARRVFGWSFHSEGGAERVASAHEFFVEALQWFGDPKPADGSPWDRAERLAGLIRQQRTLLVLDGLEPLQSESPAERGRVTDPGLATLLTDLALELDGLCVVTTREPILDLMELPEAAPHENLEHVSVDAGRAILRVGRVAGSDRALESLAGEFGCDALALKLLAAFLRGTEKRDAKNAASIAVLDAAEDPGRHARRVLHAFSERFQARPELEALYVLAMFDGPARADEIRALRTGPPIPRLNGLISSSDDHGWTRLVGALRETGLVAFEDPEREVEMHPVVRQYFSTELRERAPDAWREGHSRIYEHLVQAADAFPDTLAAMMPLFRAVAHGCQAGRWQEAAVDVYFSRIQRETSDFANVQLGALGPGLAALTHFFAVPWSRTLPFAPPKQAYLLSQAASALEGLGRFAQALETSAAAFQVDLLMSQSAPPMSRARSTYMLAAGKDSNSIAEHLLVTGPLSEAGGEAREALGIVSQLDNGFWWVVTLTTVAEVYHLMNIAEMAQECFSQAENVHRELGTRHLPTLYSRQGFRYCCFLHDQGRYQDVLARASQAIAVRDNWPIDVALDHLCLGRAHLALGDLAQAQTHLQAAVDGTRYSGESAFIVQGLRARAELRWAKGEEDRARTDIDKALWLAQWQGARMRQADCHLLRARMHAGRGDIDRGRADLARAKELIAATDYHVRDAAVTELEQRLQE